MLNFRAFVAADVFKNRLLPLVARTQLNEVRQPLPPFKIINMKTQNIFILLLVIAYACTLIKTSLVVLNVAFYPLHNNSIFIKDGSS